MKTIALLFFSLFMVKGCSKEEKKDLANAEIVYTASSRGYYQKIIVHNQEITISKVDENDNTAVTPSKMLTFFNSGYKYTLDQATTIKGKKIQYVKLVPMSSKDQRKEILLGIDSQTKQIYNLIEIGKKGTKTTLTVNSFKTNLPLSKNQFTFVKSKYPNYYINSLD